MINMTHRPHIHMRLRTLKPCLGHFVLSYLFSGLTTTMRHDFVGDRVRYVLI